MAAWITAACAVVQVVAGCPPFASVGWGGGSAWVTGLAGRSDSAEGSVPEGGGSAFGEGPDLSEGGVDGGVVVENALAETADGSDGAAWRIATAVAPEGSGGGSVGRDGGSSGRRLSTGTNSGTAVATGCTGGVVTVSERLVATQSLPSV